MNSLFGMEEIEIAESVNVEDLKGLGETSSAKTLIGFSRLPATISETLGDSSFLDFLSSEIASSGNGIALFGISGREESSPVVYFRDGEGALFNQFFDSEYLDVEKTRSFLKSIVSYRQQGLTYEQVFLSIATWMMCGASIHNEAIADSHFALIYSCIGEVSRSMNSDGDDHEYVPACLQLWLSLRERSIALSVIRLDGGVSIGWRSFDLDKFNFSRDSLPNGLMSVRIASDDGEFARTCRLRSTDSLAFVEILANPLGALKKCADQLSNWTVMSVGNPEEQRLLRMSCLGDSFLERKRGLLNRLSEPDFDLNRFETEINELIESAKIWADIASQFDFETLSHPAVYEAVATWINELSDEITILSNELEGLSVSLVPLAASANEAYEGHDNADELDPFDDRFWFRCTDSVFVRPFVPDDPIVGFIRELPYVNQINQRNGQFVDWSNSAVLPLSEKVASSVFSLAQQIARLNIQAIPPLGLNEDMSIGVTGYAQSGLFNSRRVLNAVQLTTRLSRHFRKSTYLFGILVHIDGYVALVFVSGEFYRGMRAEYARSAQERNEAKRFADYQAAAIRRELNKDY